MYYLRHASRRHSDLCLLLWMSSQYNRTGMVQISNDRGCGLFVRTRYVATDMLEIAITMMNRTRFFQSAYTRRARNTFSTGISSEQRDMSTVRTTPHNADDQNCSLHYSIQYSTVLQQCERNRIVAAESNVMYQPFIMRILQYQRGRQNEKDIASGEI